MIIRFVASFFFLSLLAGCMDWESYHVTGKYYLTAVDQGKNMSISYPTDSAGNLYATVVLPTVFEVEWNNNFIVAKQHPQSTFEAVQQVLYQQLIDSLKNRGSTRNMSWKADSLSKRRADIIVNSREFRKTKKEGVTLYYVIDVRKESSPMMFMRKSRLDSALVNMRVGELNQKKRFDYLDE